MLLAPKVTPNDPGGHAVAKPPVQYDPRVQFSHEIAPPPEYLPASHGKHDSEPWRLLYEPRTQGEQNVGDNRSMNVPAPHNDGLMQSVLPAVDEVPLTQLMQSSSDMAPYVFW